MKFKYVCVDCGKEFVTDEIIYQCPECAAKQKEGEFPRGYLKVIYDADDLRKLAEKDHVTIYDFFPYEVPNKEVYPVEITPIIVPRRLNEKLGLKNVFCKMDAYLPSGSFKDRASQLIAAQAIAHNEKRIALASTGNAGAAMSCAGAAYGLDIILFVPETAPINKLSFNIIRHFNLRPENEALVQQNLQLLQAQYLKRVHQNIQQPQQASERTTNPTS